MMKPKHAIRGAGESKTGCRPHAPDLTTNLRCGASRSRSTERR
jgi:hypothetical protein